MRARLVHPDPPAAACDIGRSWPLRATDFDVMRHMNNAVYWAAVEDELHRRRDLRAPLRAEVEFRDAIEPGDDVQLVTQDGEGELGLWLTGGAIWRRRCDRGCERRAVRPHRPADAVVREIEAAAAASAAMCGGRRSWRSGAATSTPPARSR